MKTFLIIDYWMQGIVITLVLITIPFVFVPLLILVLLGAWQLLSGLITAFFYPALKRKMYLAKSISYLLFLYLSYLLTEADLMPNFLSDTGIGFIVFWVLLPFVIGLWYYKMVSKDYHQYCEEQEVRSNTMEANSPLERQEQVFY
ncbi:MAG: hypothetical protein AB8G86_01360 [Saprospiraceae bacterium]